MSRLRRLAGFSYVGRFQYFLTFCVDQRARVFEDTDLAASTIVQIRMMSASERFENLAYCLMPDHAHWLVEGRASDANLKRFMKRAKQHSGAAYAVKQGRKLWQEGYHDRILRRDDDAFAVARYIVANPVRAGLVERADQYPFSGSDRWTMNELARMIV